MSVSTKDIAWVAGLLEGEGCFGFHRTPIIQLNMVDLDTVEHYAEVVDPHSDRDVLCYEPRSEKHKPSYHYNICGGIAIQWMMTIYPMMSERRQEKIREVIEHWKQMPGSNHNARKTHCKWGHEFTEENTYVYRNMRYCRACHYYHSRNNKDKNRG